MCQTSVKSVRLVGGSWIELVEQPSTDTIMSVRGRGGGRGRGRGRGLASTNEVEHMDDLSDVRTTKSPKCGIGWTAKDDAAIKCGLSEYGTSYSTIKQELFTGKLRNDGKPVTGK